MKKYTIQCGGMKLTAQQEPAGWRSIIDGLGKTHEAPALDEGSAKIPVWKGQEEYSRTLDFRFRSVLMILSGFQIDPLASDQKRIARALPADGRLLAVPWEYDRVIGQSEQLLVYGAQDLFSIAAR